MVGIRLAQWETWMRFDQHSGQYWHMLAYGPSSKLETTLGAVLGYDKPHPEKTEFSYAMPLLQAKYLFKEYALGKPPGVALVGGTFLPSGKGAFVPPVYGAFSFLTVSQCFGKKEDVLIHANVGLNYLYLEKKNEWVNTWGLGTQIRTIGGFHVVGEVFSGDPYVPGTGLSYQAGFRHFVSDYIQFDATLGQGLAGTNRLPFWCSFGARLVTTWFEKNRSG